MNKLLEQAFAAASHLSEDGQKEIARRIMDETKQLAIREGIADLDAGRTIAHEEMKAWLESWGSKAELDPPAVKSR
ncbi:MAG: hypothetical protein ACPGOV_10270 [Magnetovibrionaceae bacterium]